MDILHTTTLPVQFHPVVALLAALTAVGGLLLWSAGIKVARLLTAIVSGAVLSVFCFIFLPSATHMDPLAAAIGGMAAGILIGGLGFHLIQGLVLAVSLAAVLLGGFYQWQTSLYTTPTGHAGPFVAAVAAPLETPASTMPQQAGTGVGGTGVVLDQNEIRTSIVHAVVTEYRAIPPFLRQQMAVLGVGIALVAFVLAMMAPKYTTWIFTATAGAAMIVGGLLVICLLYAPQATHYLPAELRMRLAVLGGFVLLGMILQRAFFWPRKAPPRESEGRVDLRPMF